jgi:L-rhamnose mutarotase
MKKLIACLLVAALVACQEQEGATKAENAQDAGREFIRASLDGDYKKAEGYLLKDSTNLMLFEKQKANYKQLSPEQKSRNKEANIRPVSITNQDSTTTLYKYYHTGNQADTTVLRIVRRNNEWLVDLKSVIKM